MRLSYVTVCGFRGYRDLVRFNLGADFTVIDGRNGVGKSTIFDAVEFALTGQLLKYESAKAAGETVLDYVWWRGSGSSLSKRFVEVGFENEGEQIVLRRTAFDAPDPRTLEIVTRALIEADRAPSAPLTQLCASSIIRDEHIARLSLDLSEADRYALVCQAIGASDADKWIDRAKTILGICKKRSEAAQSEVRAASTQLASASKKIDELRSSVSPDDVVAGARERLRGFIRADVPMEELTGRARQEIVALVARLDALSGLVSRWEGAENAERMLPALEEARELRVEEQRRLAERVSGSRPASINLSTRSSDIAARARELIALGGAGRNIGLVGHRCPLCAASHDHASFEAGLAIIAEIAAELDREAATLAIQEAEHAAALGELAAADQALSAAAESLGAAQAYFNAFAADCVKLGVDPETGVDAARVQAEKFRAALDAAQKDLLILDTLRVSTALDQAVAAEKDAQERLARSQERAGRARKAEAAAAALHDAARRSAGETLNLRLDRVLPLMVELYKRLKPHPVWDDIDYAIRGDVRRFLSLRVGDDLNPQFLFSSGQRRATGLAFLLSVNLSIAWSRWRSVLLDDPVQHVDDFRTIHLAEVMAHLVSGGRQVVCSVEDPALADLLCRRLPIRSGGAARRITLGPGSDGALRITDERDLQVLSSRAFSIALSAAG